MLDSSIVYVFVDSLGVYIDFIYIDADLIYNRNFFEQYLLDNTILERASTSRHGYISLYEENGEMFIKLNLQARFR